ncbi:hypothetical protein J2X48_000916 [Bosea sp. BE271]|uniref:hypothetical protein n=1 Tax=Bosea TaxID=85413 RepID=UPI00285A867E|nr:MULTISPECIES: hypothetical protein [Bosea]MDR6827198.1 hypothetical protein [Bosea robiniae]MDR6893908.1 hypothetical protein [Bosea sp. BE109]MDR7137303.1 hypothetical protein [Bosea sp. BE168]MDR7174003.1 hypothetical protein [Bosea sp. BE271]
MNGYSPAEAILYWAADHAQPGAAVELSLSPGERLDVRLSYAKGQQAARYSRLAALHVNADADGVTASPPAGGHLAVTLQRIGFAASAVAPLVLAMPPEVALVIVTDHGSLIHSQPDPKSLAVRQSDQPAPPSRPPKSAARDTTTWSA